MRDLFRDIDALGEDQAEFVVGYHKWSDHDGMPLCPQCGADRFSRIEPRRSYECSDCKKEYTVTTQTVFRYSKLTYHQMLKAICLADGQTPTGPQIRKALGPMSHRTTYRVRNIIKQISKSGTICTN